MRLCYHCMTQIQNDHMHSCPYCGKSLSEERLSPKYLRPGTVLGGKFVVGYPLGAGGFGNTYIGWNKLLLRKVAIKEFFPEQYVVRAQDGVSVTVPDQKLLMRFQSGLKQFLEEARSVASLQDIRDVVEISNFFEANGTGYIIMEYLEGMDVKTILQKSGNKKDYEWCRRVILTILHTLREIHKRGVLHRDIAPDNIFVTNEGVIKLIDFGAARHSSALADMKSEIVLKSGYAPIEQYSRSAPQGPYTDMYAVAAVFYRMLTGQKPIPANERAQDDVLITPSQMGISIPQQAEMGIMVCLNVKPEYRLQSADDFMEVLDGTDFVPVYEPDWILPPVKEQGRFSGLPVGIKVLTALTVVGLMIGLGVGSYRVIRSRSADKAILADSNRPGSITLADYSGQSLDVAVEELGKLGFDDISLFYELGNAGTDTVIRQEPEPGEIRDKEHVTLYVSGGTELYTLEDFKGKDKDYIISWFSRYNFDIYDNAYPSAQMHAAEYEENSSYPKPKGRIYLACEYSDDTAAGICMEQSIEDGVVCSNEDDITFTLSCGGLSGYEYVIPDMTGMAFESAEKEIKRRGLDTVLDIESAQAETAQSGWKEGTVVGQSIAGDYVYNVLEHKVYKYNGSLRTDLHEENTLILMLNPKPKKKKASQGIQQTPPAQSPAPNTAPESEDAWSGKQQGLRSSRLCRIPHRSREMRRVWNFKFQ